jgi:N-carbamoylputrescine amidase
MSDNSPTDNLRVAAVQVHALTADVDGNVGRALELVRSQAASGADLIVLPEFFSTGYFPLYWDYDNMRLAESESGPTVTAFRDAAKELGAHIAVTFYEIDGPGLYYDSTVILDQRGETVAKYRKTHPPARVSAEKLFYRAGSRLPVFEIMGWRVGILICYDNYVPEPTRVLMTKGAEVVLAPFAELADFAMWEPLLRARAFENGMYEVVPNLVGPDADPAKGVMGGRSLLLDPEGEVIACGSASDQEVLAATFTRARLTEVRARRQFIRDRRPDLYRALVEHDEDTRGLTNGLSATLTGVDSWPA